MARDISGEMIAIARGKAGAQRIENVDFSQGTLDDPLLQAASFDRVMAFNVIHLMADVPAALTRIFELVKPGGLFLSKTPCIGDHGVLMRGLIPILRAFGRAPFVNYVKKDVLRVDVTNAGFEVVETGLYPAKSHSLFIVARKTLGS